VTPTHSYTNVSRQESHPVERESLLTLSLRSLLLLRKSKQRGREELECSRYVFFFLLSIFYLSLLFLFFLFGCLVPVEANQRITSGIERRKLKRGRQKGGAEERSQNTLPEKLNSQAEDQTKNLVPNARDRCYRQVFNISI